MARFWVDLPAGRVVRLDGASSDAIALALEPLPGHAPAVVTYRPDAAPVPQLAIEVVLRELDRVAVGLFPAWLPGAEWIDGPGGNGVAAVRTLAMRAASETEDFGPFLADLAERSLRAASCPVRGSRTASGRRGLRG